MVNSTEKDRVSKDRHETSGFPEWDVQHDLLEVLMAESLNGLVDAYN